jgi:hypothetical protein
MSKGKKFFPLLTTYHRTYYYLLLLLLLLLSIFILLVHHLPLQPFLQKTADIKVKEKMPPLLLIAS